jgi:hypothetical protein
MASIFSRLLRGTLMVRDWAATAFWIALRMRHTAKEENLWPRSGSNLATASMRPMLPAWIRSSSGTPERRYPTATDTTSRRFLSISVRRASRSPAGLSAELDLLPVRQEGVPGNAPQIRRQRAERRGVPRRS